MRAYEDFRLFVHLSDTLHFGQTSRACHVSPSALSRTIQRLERELDVVLLARDKRNVELTSPGLAFQTYARNVLEGWERFDRDLRSPAALSGRLAIFCTVTAAQSF